LARLKRASYLVPGAKVTGSQRWSTGNDSDITAAVAMAIDLRDLDAPKFTITYKAGDEPIEIHGRLLTTQPELGGVRYWFQCPRCGMRRRWLYAHDRYGRHRFACRRCQGLRYYSHRESREDRLCRKAKKLWCRAGSTDGTEPWQKPKWMRWATFSRLVLAGRSAQEAGDHIVGAKLGAGLARIQAMHHRRS
jgi:hypothetical protein